MAKLGNIVNDRYELKQQLNDNPSRQAWLATDQQTQQTVVVKLLALGGAVQWDELKLFEREAKILQKLDYPQIPKFLDYFNIDDRILWFGLVQQYIPGQSLKQKLKAQDIFSAEDCQHIAQEILQILIYLQECTPPIFHRDIKPSNIIWGEDNRLYLIDFGSVQLQPRGVAGKTFTVVGTYGYTPMEQFGGQANPSSDIYSLGATLIHLLTGVAPAEIPQEDLKLQFQPYLGSFVSPGLVRWLERCVLPDVNKRFENAQSALKALKQSSHSTTPSLTLLQGEEEQFSSPYRPKFTYVQHTSNVAKIFIPSPLQLQIIQPLTQWLAITRRSLNSWFISVVKDHHNKIRGEIITAIAIVLLLDVVFLGSYFFRLIIQIVVLFLFLLPFCFPLLLMGFFIALLSGQDLRAYVQTTYIELNHTHCLINQNQRTAKIVHGRIKLDEISAIKVRPTRTKAGAMEHELVIETDRGFTNSKGEKGVIYHLASQLSPQDLRALAQEIENWIQRHRPPTTSDDLS